jgi:hypothetical protein
VASSDAPGRVLRLEEVEAVAQEIIEYLDEHPDASDTLLGVWRWWWSHRELRRTRQLVEQALRLLQDRGAVSTRTGAEGEIKYFRHSSTRRPRRG